MKIRGCPSKWKQRLRAFPWLLQKRPTFKAEIEGKWISTILWNGLGHIAPNLIFRRHDLGPACESINRRCHVPLAIQTLEFLNIRENGVDNYKLCCRQTISSFVVNAGVSFRIGYVRLLVNSCRFAGTQPSFICQLGACRKSP